MEKYVLKYAKYDVTVMIQVPKKQRMCPLTNSCLLLLCVGVRPHLVCVG